MVVVLVAGALKVLCSYTQLKGNVWYYRRRIPEDVRALHREPVTGKTKPQLFFSLKTGDKVEACRKADAETRRLDAFWQAHRNGQSQQADPKFSLAVLQAAGVAPGDGTKYWDTPVISDLVDRIIEPREPYEPSPEVSPQDKMTLDILYGAPVPRTLSDAKKEHFELGKGPRNKIAEHQFNRAWAILLEIAGDCTLESLRREHAKEFVRRLVARGSGPETIKKYLSQVRPVINTGIREFELSIPNQFADVVIPNSGEAPRKPRKSFGDAELDAIQMRCRQEDDQRRWAIAMLSDTGARLAEIVGLGKDDVFIESAIPHVRLRWTETRRLKNIYSARLVPLIGEALWAAQKGMKTDGPFLFPVFQPRTQDKDFNAGTASAALNKWLKENGLVASGQTMHSFRHKMRDRLREIKTPVDLAQSICGWKGTGESEQYGEGHSLSLKHSELLKIVRPHSATS